MTDAYMYSGCELFPAMIYKQIKRNVDKALTAWRNCPGASCYVAHSFTTDEKECNILSFEGSVQAAEGRPPNHEPSIVNLTQITVEFHTL